MVDREEKQQRRLREREKDLRMDQRRRDKLAARMRDETFFDEGLTDKAFAHPAQKGRKRFVDSDNGN